MPCAAPARSAIACFSSMPGTLVNMLNPFVYSDEAPFLLSAAPSTSKAAAEFRPAAPTPAIICVISSRDVLFDAIPSNCISVSPKFVELLEAFFKDKDIASVRDLRSMNVMPTIASLLLPAKSKSKDF